MQPAGNQAVREEGGEIQEREGQVREGKGSDSQAYLRTRVSQVRFRGEEHPRLQGQNHGRRSKQVEDGFGEVQKHARKIINQGSGRPYLEKVRSLGGTKIR